MSSSSLQRAALALALLASCAAGAGGLGKTSPMAPLPDVRGEGRALDPLASCAELLAKAEAQLPRTPLSAASGLRAARSASDVVTISPLGLRVAVPPGQFGPAWVRARGAGLEDVRRSDREWEQAYAEVLERVLPEGALLVHASDEEWGAGVAFDGLSARLYAVAEDPHQVLEDLGKRLPWVAARVACRNERGRVFDPGVRSTVTTSQIPPWKTTRAKMRVWYGDYGGSAVVELHVRRAGPATLVLAFMFEGDRHADERAALLDMLAKP